MSASTTAFLEAVLENLTEGVVACDSQGVLTTFNRATREFHRLSEKPIPADQWVSNYNLFRDDGRTPMRKEETPLFRALTGEIVRDVEMVIVAQGEELTVVCNGQAIYDDSGKLQGAVVTMRDITEFKKVSNEIQTLNRQLEERVQTRTEELQKTNKKLSLEILEREKAENALVESEKRFRTLFEQSPLSVQLLSVDGRTIQVNSAWKRLWGFSEEFVQEYILKNYNMLEDPQLAEKGILTIIRDGFQGRGGKIPAIYYDSTVLEGKARGRWVEGYIEPVLNDAGQVQQVVLIHQDVTEKVEFERDLKAARDAAEEASRLKSAFLANMSHEIRTPLAAILGFSELLKNRQIPDEEADEYLAIIDRSGKALTKIIDDILDLSKVEAGRLKIETVSVDLNELINEVFALFRKQAQLRGISIVFENETAAEMLVQTDPARLRQILINLVGNAMKFTQAGEINTKLEILSSAGDSSLKITVRDTGVGIPTEQQANLFQPFSQIDSSRTRQFGGTGLGLVLSRRLAQAMGGDVYLQSSEIDRGSTFVVILPLVTESAKSAPSARQSLPSRSQLPTELVGLKVLIADDSDDNRILLARILTRKGAAIAQAVNGVDAILQAQAGSFDVVLMDVQMPIKDGYDAIRELRASGYTRPIIALTAHAMSEERDRCLAVGANAHFSKPIVFDELTKLILRLCS
jgi:PAS domain S-box-containing protein